MVIFKEVVDRERLRRVDDSDEYEEDYDEDLEKTKKRNFAPISGDEFLRKGKSAVDEETEQEMEQDGVRPVNVNEAKIDEEDDVINEAEELLDSTGQRINIVAIAVRKKESRSSEEDDSGEDYDSSSYSSICHTVRHVSLKNLLLDIIEKAAFIDSWKSLP
ncbi:unnamed protein product [Strongylus vulgaris]|uniref:Uncharacterized protein n=1 Tax=Strongylus vulgaris TaxID=40348 RepID=A0A3P7J4A6_STRVU|nr:unnamed protein product [Strongylus vulgaris]